MATKMVIQQPKPLVLAPGSDQWSTGICECDNLNDCKCFLCLHIIFYASESSISVCFFFFPW